MVPGLRISQSERAEWATYIAAAPRIRVHPPCSTDVVGFLDHFEVPGAILSDQLHGNIEAGHASANDKNIHVVIHDDD